MKKLHAKLDRVLKMDIGGEEKDPVIWEDADEAGRNVSSIINDSN